MFKTWQLYLSLMLITLAITYLNNEYILTDDIYSNFFRDEFSPDQIIELRKKWSWLAYFLAPALFSIKVLVVALCLSAGLFFFDLQVEFKNILRLALLAEFILLLRPLSMIIWFGPLDTPYTLESIQNFAPLSMLNFFDATVLDPWIKYPLSVASVFEVLYVLILTLGLSQQIKKDFQESFKIVVCSYGSGLLTWITLVAFLLINFS